MHAMNNIDWLALLLWLGCWGAYGAWSAKASHIQPSLMGTVAHHRRRWMSEAFKRENRITDSSLTTALMQSATFFSSTTILILGALFAVLGSIERGGDILDVVKALPLARQVSQQLLEIKTLLLASVFVYSFLRFSMSLRQFNLIIILIGALPPSAGDKDALAYRQGELMTSQAAGLNELAGNNFTHGLRAYYFAVPLVLWLVNPWLFVAGTLLITLVTYYMEFHSATVKALSEKIPDQ